MMRMYTYSLLKKLSQDERPIEDKDILAWANSKLTAENSMSSFQDKKVRTAKPVLELIDAMKPQAINPSIVKSGDGLSYEASRVIFLDTYIYLLVFFTFVMNTRTTRLLSGLKTLHSTESYFWL